MKPPPPPLSTPRRSTQRGEQRAGDPGDVEAEHHQALQPDAPAEARVRDEGGDDQGVDRQPRRAGHQRRDQDRRQPVLGVVDRARRHDPRNRAGEARQQGNESAAGQADAVHQPVHQERGADHVAGAFQQQDEEEQDQDLRQEGDRPRRRRRSRRRRPASAAGPAGSASRATARQPGDAALDPRRPAPALHANTAWNMTNMIAARISGPDDG